MSNSTALVIVGETDLDKNLAESQLSTEGIQGLRSAFAPHFQAFTKLATSAQSIPQDAPITVARTMRLELRKIRIASEKTRKELVEDSVLRSRAVNGVNSLLLYALKPIEDHLQQIEDRDAIAEAARIEGLRSIRLVELAKYTEAPTYDIGVLPQAQFDAILGAAKKAHEDKLAAEAKAIADRAAKEKADEAERIRLKTENDRLAKVAADAEKARVASEAKARQEKAERDAADKARQAKEDAEKKRLADEAAAKQKAIEDAARKDREAAEKKANEERAKREQLEAEIKRREKEEADKKLAEQAAAEAALKSPDKDKLIALAKVIRGIALPTLTSKSGKAFAPKLTQQVDKMAAWVEDSAKTL